MPVTKRPWVPVSGQYMVGATYTVRLKLTLRAPSIVFPARQLYESGPVGCHNLSVMPMTEQLLCGNKCGVQAPPNLLPIHSSEVGIAACLSPRDRGFQSLKLV